MKFFCTIYEPIDGGYKILLNATNIHFIPNNVALKNDTSKDTLRRVFINADLNVGDLIYVSESELAPGGKLIVKSAHLLSNIDIQDKAILESKPIEDDIKQMVLCKDTKPVDLYKLCLTK